MNIIKIEIIHLEIPYEHPFQFALAVMDRARNLVVRIEDDQGMVGVGEGCPAPFVTGELPETAFSAAQVYAKILIGKDPLEITARMDELEISLRKNPTVQCAYDMALHDLLARHANLPLFALFGGTKRVIHSNRTIGLDTPEAMAAAAKTFVDLGARSLKIKVGTGQEEDIARIEAIRRVVSNGISLRVDANQAWDESTAISTLTAMAKFNIQVCEQPLPWWNEAGLKRLRERSSIPIMADETVFDHYDAFRLASAGGVDYFNIKLGKSAGLRNALKINTIGESAGIKCLLGGMSESLIGVSAGAHLICACPNISLADLDSPFHFKENPIQGGVVFQPDGTVTLSDSPGHGADVKPEWIARNQMIVITDKIL